MTIDKKELAKLSPAERVKKLKLMEEERKKEVDEIERLIKESMQELKIGKIAEEVAPEQRAVDISRLFETRGEEKLERTAREEAPPSALMKGTKGYQAMFEQALYDYNTSRKILGYAAMGLLSEEQLTAVDSINERIDRTKYQNVSAEVANILVATRSALHKIRRYAGME